MGTVESVLNDFLHVVKLLRLEAEESGTSKAFLEAFDNVFDEKKQTLWSLLDLQHAENKTA